MIFAMPYVLTKSDYAEFSALFAISQLIGVIGGAGLEIASARLAVSPLRSLSLGSTSIITAAVGLYLYFQPDSLWMYSMAALVAISAALSQIMQSYFIYYGAVLYYSAAGMLRIILFLPSIFLLIFFGFSGAVAWVIASLFSSVLILTLSLRNISKLKILFKPVSWRETLSSSIPMAVIFAANTLPFTLDRAIAQAYMPGEDFARYAVALTWVTPLIYLGNLFQQHLLASKDFLRKIDLYTSISGLIVAGIIYYFTLRILVIPFIKIPFFESKAEFYLIWEAVLIWYAIYVAIVFPCAFIIQKNMGLGGIKKLAILSASTALVVMAGPWLSIRANSPLFGFYTPNIFLAAFAILALLIKVPLICRDTRSS